MAESSDDAVTPVQEETTTYFNDMATYRQALLVSLHNASRNVDWFDHSFADTNIHTSSCTGQLLRFLQADTAKMRLLLRDGDFICRQSPRLVPLLVRFSHHGEIRRVTAACRMVEDDFLITDTAVVHRFNHALPRGKWSADAAIVAQFRGKFEEMWRESAPFSDWRQLHL